MKQTQFTKGYIPTSQDIENLQVGDYLPNVFGQMKKIVSIHHKGIDIEGNAYACFYQQFSETSSMSNSVKANRAI